MFYPTARSDGGADYGISCVEAVTSVDPEGTAGATALLLSDDDCREVTLSKPLVFGNQAFEILYIGSNGYITFDYCDRSWWPSITNHFRQRRISAMYMDLDPSMGGLVSHKAVEDGLWVTFYNVPRFARSSDTYTFQYKLFSDGRVQMTWVNYTGAHTIIIVGVSTGRYPRGWNSVDLMARIDTSIDCSSPATIESRVPWRERAPTQEFYHTAPGTTDSTADGDELRRDDEEELGRVDAASSKQNAAATMTSRYDNRFDLIGQKVMWEPLAYDAYQILCHEASSMRSSRLTPLVLGDDDSQFVSFDGARTV
eukprot:gene2458-3193_t